MTLSRALRRLGGANGRFVRVVVAGIVAAGVAALLPALASATSVDAVKVHVTRSDGFNGLAGVAIHYQCNGGSIDNFGTTGSDGYAGPMNLPDGASCTFTAIYGGTTSAPRTVTITNPTSDVSFQTSAVKVTLSDHGGGPLSSGVASYKSGSTTYYLNGTSAASTTDATGAVTGQLFDGTYDFRMVYGPGSEWKYGVTVNGDTTVPFQTGLLSIVYSNSLSYGGPVGDSAFFTKTGTEVLPGTFTFHPRGVGYPSGSGCHPISITLPEDFAGTSATKTILAAQLEDSSGAPLSGADASYYHLSWKPMGTTDGTGSVCAVVDGALGNTYVAMSYNGTRQQISQNAATDSIYNFQTTDVTVQLENHRGSLIDTGTASYYAVSWHTIGDTSGGKVDVQMLPGSYSFAMVFNHTRQQMNGVAISASPTTVTFQTELVNVELQAQHSILSIPENGSASYYADGWHPITTPNTNNPSIVQAEMLPGTYSFAATYNGTREQKTATINTPNPANDATGNTQIVYFHAALVTLLDSNGDSIPGSYYANGWHSITTMGAEMLPGTYTFGATYNGTNYQKSYTIAEPNPNNGENWTQTVTLP